MMTDAEVDALIRSDQGDSYYVTLPDGTTRNIGFTAESWSDPSERRAAARRILDES